MGVITAGLAPVQFDKFGGLVQSWDADKLNSDLAAEAVNVKLIPGGVSTREGLVTAFQSPTGKAGQAGAIRGLVGYVNDVSGVQLPLVLDASGNLYIESPAGSGALRGVPAAADAPAIPAGARMVGADAYTRAYLAFGDLKAGLGTPAVFDGAMLRPLQVVGPPNPTIASPTTAPTTGEVVGGDQPARTYNLCYTYTGALSNAPLAPTLSVGNVGTDNPYDAWAVVTYVYADGSESTASNVSYVHVGSNQTIVVGSPIAAINAVGYNVYAGTAINNLSLQNQTNPIPIGSTYEGGGYLSSNGAPAPPAVAQYSFPETARSPISEQVLDADSLATVNAPLGGAPSQAQGYNVYAVDDGANFYLQTPNPLPLSQGWTEPNGLINWTGPAPATSNITKISGASANVGSGNVPTGLRWGIICYLLSDTVIENGVITAVGTISIASPPFPIYVGASGAELTISNIPVSTDASVVGRLIAFTVAGGSAGGDFMYIGEAANVGGVAMSATVIPDNTSTSLTVNFTDNFLATETDITDALTRVIPSSATGVMFSPSTRRLYYWGDPAHPSVIQSTESDDPGNFQGDTGLIFVSENDGTAITAMAETRWGVILVGKQSSLYRIEPNNNTQSTWRVIALSAKVGVCGPMAMDAFESSAVFVHDTGVYLIDMTNDPPAPTLISDELIGVSADKPGYWQRINWSQREKIWVHVDEIEKELRIGVPLDNSTECSHILKCNFRQGWDVGYAYSPFSLKWHWRAGRKWSIDLIPASVCARIQRPFGPQPAPSMPANREQALSQILLGSSGNDGTVNMISPDARDDNGTPITWSYQSGTTNSMEARTQARVGVDVATLVQVNARGQGQFTVQVVDEAGNLTRPYGVQIAGNVRADRSVPVIMTGERLGLRFSGTQQSPSWCTLGLAAIYCRPFAAARPWPTKAT